MSTEWRQCFVFQGDISLLRILCNLLQTNVNSRCVKAVLSCVHQLFEFAAQMLEGCGLTIAGECGRQCRSLQIDTRAVNLSDDNHEFANASTLLLEFFAEAYCFQECCWQVSTRSRTRRNRRSASRPALPVARLFARVSAAAPPSTCCDGSPIRRSTRNEHWCVPQLSATRCRALTGAEQQSAFAAALHHDRLRRYPLDPFRNCEQKDYKPDVGCWLLFLKAYNNLHTQIYREASVDAENYTIPRVDGFDPPDAAALRNSVLQLAIART